MGVLLTRRRQTRLCLLVFVVLLLGGAVLSSIPHVRAWYHYRAAQESLARYHFAEARNHLALVLRAWPNSWHVRLLAARAARMDDALEEAEQHQSHAQKARPTDPDVLLEWALLRASRGSLAEVEAYLFEQLRQGSPQATLIQEAFIKGSLRLYRIPQALSGVEDWLSRQPDDTQALFLRGCIWQQVRNPQTALLSYRRVVEIDPQRDDARWHLAQCLLEINRSAEARTHLEYLHSRYPDNEKQTVALARAQLEQGQLAEARQLLQDVLAEHPACVAALTARGQLALTADNDVVEAEKWLRQAARLNPRNPQILQ
jgi:tetratricopeptide (TPR) repeat protein